MERSTTIMKRSTLLATLCALPLSAAIAQDLQVSIKDPWVRATVPQQTATGAFMQLTAPQAARLVEARSPVAAQAEIHEMKMEGNVMRMRAMPALELAAGRPVELKPGGWHIMLTGLKAPVKVGDAVPLTLVFEDAERRRQTVEVSAPVRPLGTAGGGHTGH